LSDGCSAQRGQRLRFACLAEETVQQGQASVLCNNNSSARQWLIVKRHVSKCFNSVATATHSGPLPILSDFAAGPISENAGMLSASSAGELDERQDYDQVSVLRCFNWTALNTFQSGRLCIHFGMVINDSSG
jgi:hypothetical protein